jgi:hypothetical protein
MHTIICRCNYTFGHRLTVIPVTIVFVYTRRGRLTNTLAAIAESWHCLVWLSVLSPRTNNELRKVAFLLHTSRTLVLLCIKETNVLWRLFRLLVYLPLGYYFVDETDCTLVERYRRYLDLLLHVTTARYFATLLPFAQTTVMLSVVFIPLNHAMWSNWKYGVIFCSQWCNIALYYFLYKHGKCNNNVTVTCFDRCGWSSGFYS